MCCMMEQKEESWIYIEGVFVSLFRLNGYVFILRLLVWICFKGKQEEVIDLGSGENVGLDWFLGDSGFRFIQFSRYLFF